MFSMRYFTQGQLVVQVCEHGATNYLRHVAKWEQMVKITNPAH
jgi:hypothetical protein